MAPVIKPPIRVKKTMSEEASSQWSCPVCTLANAYLDTSCAACGSTSPLVLESFACEEQLRSSASGSRGGSPRRPGQHPRSGSQDSMASSTFTEDDAELDPWTQAEIEWAQVEAHQEETKPKRK